MFKYFNFYTKFKICLRSIKKNKPCLLLFDYNYKYNTERFKFFHSAKYNSNFDFKNAIFKQNFHIHMIAVKTAFCIGNCRTFRLSKQTSNNITILLSIAENESVYFR